VNVNAVARAVGRARDGDDGVRARKTPARSGRRLDLDFVSCRSVSLRVAVGGRSHAERDDEAASHRVSARVKRTRKRITETNVLRRKLSQAARRDAKQAQAQAHAGQTRSGRSSDSNSDSSQQARQRTPTPTPAEPTPTHHRRHVRHVRAVGKRATSNGCQLTIGGQSNAAGSLVAQRAQAAETRRVSAVLTSRL